MIVSLLAYHALGVGSFDAHPHLKLIGEEIAAKCKGLPLAVKTLGGLLRSTSDTREWEDIRDSKIWNLPKGKDDILLALKLSYIHLPPHLKRCFVFCAIFPQDYEFHRDELVLLWMAEGLVPMSRENGRSRIVYQGKKQFDELLSRSFFQRSTQNESLFVMHDLMHDLATSIGSKTCLNVEENEIEDVKCKSPEKIRHLSYSSISSEMDAKFEKCHVLKVLRTFDALNRVYPGNLSDKGLEELLQNLKYLRALSLRCYHIDKIPNSIERLKHLRYLNFSGTSRLEKLPESICTLYNLETLILNGCSELTELPPGMDKLINLKCLDIRDTPELKKMPVELGRMHNFEILSKFIVGREDGLRLKVLGNLQHLQRELSIWDLQNVEDVRDARDTRLSGMVGLTTLALKWGSRNDGNADKEKQVLEFLQPHQAIKEVEIGGYGGITFPLWIGSPSMAHITKVRLGFCATITTLPSFGLLPCLRELEMKSMDALCSVGSEFYGNGERPPFPSLEVLVFIDMPAWEVWSSSCGDKEIEEPFPRLIRLKLYECPRLVSHLPHRLCSLVKLNIYKCPLLKASPCMADMSSLKDLSLTDCNHDLLVMISSVITIAPVEIILVSIQKLKYLNEDTLRAAEHLKIRKCAELIGLWDDNVSEPVLVSPTRLKYLSIESCGNLQELPNNIQRLTSLRELTIEGCSKLQSLPEEIMSCNLVKLRIAKCGISLEVAKLPNTLTSLDVRECEILERLSEAVATINDDGHNGDSSSSSSSSNNAMHLQLEELDIGSCNIRKMPCFLSMHTTLTKLSLFNCPYLEVDVFPKLPSCLRSLSLWECNKIKTLPQQMHTTLTSLQCLALKGLSIESFPEGGLPLSIEELTIADCSKLKQPLEEWGLHRLTTLKELSIYGEIGSLCLQEGGIMTCFPPLPSDWLFLPSNLEELEIYNSQDMVRLSDGLRDHLTCLKQLRLLYCPKLEFLPKEGFPPTLEDLLIMVCSQDIQRKCSKNGEYFPLIGSIPGFGFTY